MDSIYALAERHDLDTLAWLIDPEEKPDYAFYETLIGESPGLVMDAGCGTGRLMTVLLQAGFKVEGCDISELLLDLCRKNVTAAGFEPVLYHTPVQDLAFTNKYSVILLACGTFQCLTNGRDVEKCLAAFRQNLVPGGRIALSIMPASYLHRANGPFPTPWEPYYEFKFPENAGDLIVDWRATSMDVREQVVKEECRYHWVKDGKTVREETDPGEHRWYHREQLTKMLHDSGFKDVEIVANYSRELPITDTVPLCYVATRA